MSEPEIFTVGWICASATEYAAARAFLDKELPDVKAVAPHDNNEYSLGVMGRHNVVIASLPGECGSSSAATVARDMMHTFPNIRVGLLVGIGGGAPTEDRPIQLGDVVVSRSLDGHGGVFRYDFGKAIQAQEFQHTGFLNQCPPLLRAAANGLEARHESDGHHIQQNIHSAFERKPRLKKKYGRPPPESDRLYHSTVLHPVNSGTGSCVELCSDKTSDIIQRKQRDSEDDDPQIYYGLIASANSLMKDAIIRDKFAKLKGVLCFEMEAAGLMNHFPCLVIRGICDYSDTHKNKLWQGYAAMTAAAYAKELLGRIPPERVQETRRLTEVMDETAQAISELRSEVQEIDRAQALRAGQQRQYAITYDQRRILQTLKRCDYESFKERNPERALGTCTWVEEHPRYLDWKGKKLSDLLWISADPGCGKSVLARAFINEPGFCRSEDTITCYFFFKDNDEQNSLTIAICSLLHQLFSQQPELLELAMPSWHKTGEQIRYDVYELWRIFMKIISAHDSRPVLCVIDALDECRDQDRPLLLKLLHDFFNETKRLPDETHSTKLIVTSRPYSDIEQQLGSIPEIRLRGEEENEILHKEINFVIKGRVQQLAKTLGMNSAAQSSLEQKLLRMDHRTYLWMHLAFADIQQKYERSLRLEREDIDTIPISVYDAYSKMLSRIVDTRNKMARTTLGIILGARRPFSVNEFAYALGIASESETPDLKTVKLRLDLTRWIRRNCNLFVHFNNQKVYLIHQTAEDFLIRSNEVHRLKWSWSFTITEVEKLMTTICIKALCSSSIEEGYLEELKGIQKHFLDYCAEFWLSHSHSNYQSISTLLDKQIDALHEVQSERFKYWFDIYWNRHYASPKKPEMTKVRLCAFTGHVNWLAKSVDYQSDELSITDDTGRNALHWACERGNLGTARQLLIKGANVNGEGGPFGSALMAASERGHIRIVKVLLDNGANVNAEGEYCGSALQAASIGGYTKIIKLLLDKGANINKEGGFNGSALQAASACGHAKIVKFLLSKGANVNNEVGFYGSALQTASRRGYTRIAKLLLDRGANVNAKGGFYGSALLNASDNGYTETVKLLLDRGANLNAEGRPFPSPLHVASEGGYTKIVKLLLDKGADINADGGDHGYTLHGAATRGNTGTIELLLKRGANIDIQGEYQGSALQAASVAGHFEAVKLLLDKGARVNTKGGHFGSALQAASAFGHFKVVKLLLDKGANVNNKGGCYGSALQAASADGDSRVVKLLLDKGASVNTKGGHFGSALQAALATRHTNIVKLLRRKGQIRRRYALFTWRRLRRARAKYRPGSIIK